VAAERRAVLAPAEQRRGALAVRDHRAHGEAAAEALGERDDVGHDLAADLGLLVREPRAGAPDAGLHLVEHEQRAVPGGEVARGDEVARREGAHARLALHGLDDERGDLAALGHGRGRERLLERGDVVERDELDPARERLERLAVRGLRRQRERPHGPAVEAALEREDARASRAARHLERRLVGLRARVREEHARALGCLGEREQALGERDLRRGAEEVRDVAERAELGRDRGRERRVRVAERVHRDAREEVEVPLPVGVPHVRALAAHEDALRRAERVHDRVGVPVRPLRDGAVGRRGDVLGGGRGGRPAGRRLGHAAPPAVGVAAGAASGTTIVPLPWVVKTSSRVECGTRPSITVAAGTPPSTARRHASILGTMPAESDGRSAASSEREICATSEPRSGHDVYRPSTSVSTTSFFAPSATASAAAAVSALTLSTCVGSSRSGAIVETTGMRPASSRSWTAAGCTSTTSPTSPTSTGSPSTVACRRWACRRPPSSPESPTAYGPWALMRPTSSRDTWPVRTMRTTSIASGVVTRSPPRNSDSMPSRSSIAEICGPPPCTTTGRRPTRRRNTMSCANAALSVSSTMALPPYLTTTSAPANSWSHGRASTSTSAFCSGRRSVRVSNAASSGWGVGAVGSLMRSTRCSRGRSRA